MKEEEDEEGKNGGPTLTKSISLPVFCCWTCKPVRWWCLQVTLPAPSTLPHSPSTFLHLPSVSHFPVIILHLHSISYFAFHHFHMILHLAALFFTLPPLLDPLPPSLLFLHPLARRHHDGQNKKEYFLVLNFVCLARYFKVASWRG